MKIIVYKDPKFKVGDFVRISKYQKKIRKVMYQIGPKKFLLLMRLNILNKHKYLNKFLLI